MSSFRPVVLAALGWVLGLGGCADRTAQTPGAPWAGASASGAAKVRSPAQVSKAGAMEQSKGVKTGLAGAASVEKSEEEWRKQLTPEQFQVLRQKGTERPFTGKYWNHKGEGIYSCAGCGLELFRSDTKYDSGCGWPSFWDAVDPAKIIQQEDLSHGMRRIEVLCSRCGGHLGHLFPDGPQPTGLRYCINSASLEFVPAEGDKP